MSISVRTATSSMLASCNKHVVDIALQAVFVDAETRRRIALRIAIDDEHAPAFNGKRRTEIDGRRALSDAAFLIDEGDNATQPMAAVKQSAR